MWSVWLVFCDWGVHSVHPLTDKDKRLMEASWWERLTVGETGAYFDVRGHVHWKRPWCWGRLKAGREGDNRGWDGFMASLTWWTWVWASSGSWWWTGKPGVLQSMGSQRVRHDWETELNWTLSRCMPKSEIARSYGSFFLKEHPYCSPKLVLLIQSDENNTAPVTS